MALAYPADVVASVKRVLEDTAAGPVAAWKLIEKTLKSHNILYTTVISPEHVLCHPSNRGQLGLNPRTAHRTGSRILAIGCDRSELEKAVCIEICPEKTGRDFQVAFNMDLVQRSGGLLAPVSGAERYMSLGGGHAIAFFRACLHGCDTSEASIADTEGKLNLSTFSHKDATFAECTRGWQVTVLPWLVQQTWPTLPSLVQRALNASQNVAEHQTELETMCTIAEYADQAKDENPNWDECIAAAISSRPPCASYGTILGRYVRYYSGGRGAPIIRWLDGFSKRYATNVRLGEEFLRAVAETTFSDTHRFPMCRQAFLAANLIAARIVDGVAKCIVKSDIQKLANKEKVKILAEAEEMFMEADKHLKACVAAVGVQQNVADDIYGRLLVRTALHLVAKGKLCFDKTEYTSLAEIKRKCLDEMVAKKVDTARLWHDAAGHSDAPPALAGQPSSAPTTFANLNDSSWIASQKGFTTGCFVSQKSDKSAALYKVTGINHAVQLELHTLRFGEALAEPAATSVSTVALEVLMKDYAIFKGEVPRLLPNTWGARVCTMDAGYHFDLVRAMVVQGINEVHGKKKHADVDQDIVLGIHPTNVFTSAPLKKGELVLVPMVTLKDIVSKETDYMVRIWDQTAYLRKPQQPATGNPADWQLYISVFFWVGSTDNPDDVNVDYKFEKASNGTVVPIITNNKPIAKGTKVLLLKRDKASPATSVAQAAASPKAKASASKPSTPAAKRQKK